MKNFEKHIFGLILGSIFPISMGYILVTIWFILDRSETRAPFYLAAGLIIGILIDLKFLKTWINKRYELPLWSIIMIYIVCNIFVYGFFMGFPLFNVFLGSLAGFYFGKRICYNKVKLERHPTIINQVSLISGLIMTIVCISSGFLALMDYGAAGMIKNVLGLDFEVTNSMMIGIVFIGGLIMIVTNILLTRFTITKTINNYS